MLPLRSFILTLLVFFSQFCLADEVTNQYDTMFMNAANTYINGKTTLLKTQCVVESGLNPFAVESKVSYTVGICQFKLTTFNWLKQKYWYLLKRNHHEIKNITDPNSSIILAAVYLMDIKFEWEKYAIKNNITIDDDDLTKLTIASFNAGSYNIVKARKKCLIYSSSLEVCNTYNGIIAHLHSITGKKKVRLLLPMY